jgi:hypothetical protein
VILKSNIRVKNSEHLPISRENIQMNTIRKKMDNVVAIEEEKCTNTQR